MNDEHKRLMEMLAEQEASISAFERSMQDINNQVDLQAVLKSIDHCRDENNNLKAMLKQVSDNIIAPLQEELKRTEMRMNSQCKQIVQQENDIELRKSKGLELSQKNQSLKSKAEVLRQEKNILSEELEEMDKNHKSELSRAIVDNIATLAEKEWVYKKEIKSKDTEINLIKVDIKKMHEDFQIQFSAKQQTYQEELQKLIKQNKEQQFKLKEQTTSNATQISSLQGEKQHLTESLKQKEVDIEKIKTENEEKLNAYKNECHLNIEEILATSSKTNQERNNEIQSLKDNNDTLTQSIEKIKEKLLQKKQKMALLQYNHVEEIDMITQHYEESHEEIINDYLKEEENLQSNLESQQQKLVHICEEQKDVVSIATIYLEGFMLELQAFKEQRYILSEPKIKVEYVLQRLNRLLQLITYE